ncbi:hypothetical protein D1006_38215 [Burkholderia stabilis]|uniref:Uncharacterized protein n=1 Tax=Burkholderia stabilis TaxID=95485 RepID=A0A4Q2A988_9BURK|nr:hypothetical protein D1006_38215 [Burkholderia stabilis]
MGQPFSICEAEPCELGSFSRHKAAQDAHTWAATAGITLETGLTQLVRSMPADRKGTFRV